MKKRMISCVCLATLVLIGSSSVLAGNRPGAVTVSLSDGYYYFASKRKLNNNYMPNIAFDYNFDQRWGIEGGVGLINTDTTAYNSNPGVGTHGYLYTVDGLYRFQPYQCIEPYVLAGVGVLGLKPNGLESNYQGNVNAGIGSEFFIYKSIALKAEARDIYTLSGGKNDYLINFGINFLFDTCWSNPKC